MSEEKIKELEMQRRLAKAEADLWQIQHPVKAMIQTQAPFALGMLFIVLSMFSGLVLMMWVGKLLLSK